MNTPNTPKPYYRRVCTIAGSDSGGGAGIQADLKTVSALGCYGTSVITSLTAQNTVAVQAVHSPPAEFIGQQIDAVFADIGSDAVKIGMLANPDIVRVVAERLRYWQAQHIVLDPVMVAKSGDRLLAQEAEQVILQQLLPIATLVTPNIPEAEVLCGFRIGQDSDSQRHACERLLDYGPQAVLLKGGHLESDECVDWLAVRSAQGAITFHRWHSPRITTPNTHGTGCSLSAAIAAKLAQGEPLDQAVGQARDYLINAISAGADYTLGQGHGPVHHFHAWWR